VQILLDLPGPTSSPSTTSTTLNPKNAGKICRKPAIDVQNGFRQVDVSHQPHIEGLASELAGE
jgi:hypothetical protein